MTRETDIQDRYNSTLAPSSRIKVIIEIESGYYKIYKENDGSLIGTINMISNFSNCGVLDLHCLSSPITHQNISIILAVAHINCLLQGHSIMTYNTNNEQIPIRDALIKDGFKELSGFKNRSSGR